MRFRLHKVVVFSVAVLALFTGCAQFTGVPPAPAADSQTQGTVIISVTHDSAGGMLVEPIFFLSSGNNRQPLELRSRQLVAGVPGRSDFSDGYGHVYVLGLPAGSHQITGWQTGTGKPRIVPRDAPPPLRFDVKAGEVIYLGNLHVTHKMGRTLIGIPAVQAAHAEVRERRAADLPIAERKVPAIKGRAVNRLLPRGEWFGASKETVQTEE